MSLAFDKQSHRRLNPLTGEWVLVSPGRTERPWMGQVEPAATAKVPEYDPVCYMCPGNTRANGEHNPQYISTYVFENDYAALRLGGESYAMDVSGLLVAKAERGICKVVCLSPRHDSTFATMSPTEIREVVNAWTEQYLSLGNESQINSVLIFENRGAMMGASNPHPHTQIWANATLPNETVKEQKSFLDYQREHLSCLLCEYLKLEMERSERLVSENEEFAAIVPFWAVWPFEIIIISKKHVGSLEQFSVAGRDGLADILHRVTTRYDGLFGTPFPYSMGFHQRPTDGEAHTEWHFHAHFYPPLLRSAVVRKFIVGYELLAAPQRDITPEEAASRLRDVGSHAR